MEKIIIEALLKYLKEVKEELEKEGYVPTIEMAIERVEAQIIKLNNK